MKKLIAIIAVSTLFTGCAAVGTSIERSLTPSTQLAQQDCVKMGFQFGTPRYQDCVLSVSNNIRSTRAQQQQQRSRDVVCRPWLNGVRCEEQ